MSRRTAILDLVGLSARHLGRDCPKLAAWAAKRTVRRIDPVLPALTCSAQSTYLTGFPPAKHGSVGNGWYDRTLHEHHFWKQSNALIQGPKLWETLRAENPNFKTAKLFWWYNMYSSAEISVTPRPLYPADGRKFFDIHTHPIDLRPKLKADLGPFPFPAFWGPTAGLPSSAWISACARWIEEKESPDLSLVYLPHLDYDLQRFGPDDPRSKQACADLDTLASDLIAFYEARGVTVVVLSEYALTKADRPVHINRVLRQHGWLSFKDELGLEKLDTGTCRAFALADHQIAHVYVPDATLRPAVKAALEAVPGVEKVLEGESLRAAGLDHERAGDLVAVADASSWFTYYHWEDEKLAPEYARCVDIHRKHGYDPVELFFDPTKPLIKLRAAGKLLRKMLGFRMMMDLIPLDATLVKGSHGRRPEDTLDWPVLIGPVTASETPLAATEVHGELLRVCRG